MTTTSSLAKYIIDVPVHGWTLHNLPDTGHVYGFNHLTKKTTWQPPISTCHPPPPFVAFPPPIPTYRLMVSEGEMPIDKERLPGTNIYVIWTNFGNRYLFDMRSKRSTWRPIPTIISQLEEVENIRKFKIDLLEKTKLKKLEENLKPILLENNEEKSNLTNETIFNKENNNKEEILDELFEEKAYKFVELLTSKNISAFASWCTVGPYLDDCGLGERERENLFSRFCEERAQEIRESKLSKESLDPFTIYSDLVKENRNLFWEEFKQRFRRDPRFYRYGTNDREREKLFKEQRSKKNNLKKQ